MLSMQSSGIRQQAVALLIPSARYLSTLACNQCLGPSLQPISLPLRDSGLLKLQRPNRLTDPHGLRAQVLWVMYIRASLAGGFCCSLQMSL